MEVCGETDKSKLGDSALEAACWGCTREAHPGLDPARLGPAGEAFELLQKPESLCLELGNRSGLAYCYANWGLLARETARSQNGEEKAGCRPWPEQTQMSTIALIDTRLKIPGESIGTVVSTHETIRAAFKANEAFQKRMRDSGVKDHVPTKIVTLKVRLGDGEHVRPGVHS